jgi:hypothetical protein
MIRTLPEFPDRDSGHGFARLLDRHLSDGTRPNATPDQPGRRWTNVAFAKVCNTNERTVRFWRTGDHLPNDLRTIERELFGDNTAYTVWRQELSDAYDAAKHVRDMSADAEHAPAAGIEPPDLCLGRDADTELLLAALRGPLDVTAIVLGQAGIGKTTLTRQVAASPDLAARFGDRRWFVALETALDRAGLRERVVVALGANPAEPTAFDHACRTLAETPGLLALDNLETPWEADMPRVQDDLRRLAAIPGLSLLASLRGTVPPDRPAFTHRVRLDPLLDNPARTLFLTHAPNILSSDPHLPDFLRALGGIPLAIELVACRGARGVAAGSGALLRHPGTLQHRLGPPPPRPDRHRRRAGVARRSGPAGLDLDRPPGPAAGVG